MFSDPTKNLTHLDLMDGHVVVDLGAGSGFYALSAATTVLPRGRVIAVEIQRDLISKIKSEAHNHKLGNIEAVWGNIESVGGTGLRDAIADRAILANTLFLVEDREHLVLEIKRLLKSGGKVLIVDWSEVSTLSPRTIVSKETVKDIFEKHDFILDHDFDAGDHHYGLVFKIK